MKEIIVLIVYRALLPLLFIAAFPGWVLKMIRRGGFGSGLLERIGIYISGETEFEPSGAIHLHAVSVGETIIALKLLKAWRENYPSSRFVLATGTATGHQTATQSEIPGLRVTYSPLDFPWMIRNYLNRFEPSRIILIEGEIWPNLLRLAEKRQIPIALANARVSPRSAKRFNKFASLIRPFFSRLSTVCIQEEEDRKLWENLGINPRNIHHTGSIKFDPQSSIRPEQRPEFAEILNAFGKNRPVILAASTFKGEEALIANAIHSANPNALPVIVPRHAERRSEVSKSLSDAGFHVTLRSTISESTPANPELKSTLVIDSTGELSTWTAHADIIIIGKSFLSTGGQNPAEAILSGKPLILGPHMENFQALVTNLHASGGVLLAHDEAEIRSAILKALDPKVSQHLTENASRVLAIHNGATRRHLKVLHPHTKNA